MKGVYMPSDDSVNAQSTSNLIWIDLEMTGLDTVNDHILEIATIVTDSQLRILEEGPTYTIYQPKEILDDMGDWCQKQHRKSGLLERVSKKGVSLQIAEKGTLDFVSKHVASNVSPMCGSSICQDRRFLARYMPKLEVYFHYRHIDVSTVKELALRWVPDMPKFPKKSKHLALEDIKDSIDELKYYRERFFKVAR
jgi:oligoribonuclease